MIGASASIIAILVMVLTRMPQRSECSIKVSKLDTCPLIFNYLHIEV